ncbi:MAG: carbohydrate binding family 9 domain-containing protein [Armatimonadota bacterium]
MRFHLLRFLLLLILTAVFNSAVVCAERPVIPAVMVDAAPKIDGDLSDPCWQQAPVYSDFYLPDDSSKAPEETIVRLCYDQKNMYVSFYCKDSQPGKISAQQKRRRGSMGSDDRVEIHIDCFNSFNFDQFACLQATAGGTQHEVLQSGDVSKIEWKGDWYAGSKLVADGYTVEFAIPFAILQYDSKSTKMGVMFARKHIRTSKWWTSPDIGNNWDPKKFYIWDGLKLPECKRVPIVMGYTLLGSGKDKDPLKVGLDAKYAFNSRFTGLLTVNPDFSNVEQQVDSVDFSYNERYLSDSRPYFQEGNQYLPGSDIFYTRRIEEINYGGKFIGKIGAYNLGAMSVFGPNRMNDSIFRLSRELSNKGKISVAAVNSEGDDISNFTSQFSGDYRLYEKGKKRLTVYGNLGTTDSPTGDGVGKRAEGGFYYGAGQGKLEFSGGFGNIDADYRPSLGLFTEPDKKNWYGSVSIFNSPKKGPIQEWYMGLDATKAEHQDGSLYHNDMGFNSSMSWHNGTGVSFCAGMSDHEGISDRPEFRVFKDRGLYFGYWWGGKTLYRGGSTSLAIGKSAGGQHIDWNIGQGWNLSDKLTVHAGYEFSRIEEPSPFAYSLSQTISSLVYDLNDEKAISSRLVTRGGNSNLYFAYRQRSRKGMDIYVTVGDPNSATTKYSLTVKLVKVL